MPATLPISRENAATVPVAGEFALPAVVDGNSPVCAQPVSLGSRLAMTAAVPGDAAAEALILALATEFHAAYKAHAAYEELVMHQFFYKNVDRHAEHHTMHLDALTTLLHAEPVLEAIRINLPFINSTVFDHIERDDRDFGCHLKSLGLYGRI